MNDTVNKPLTPDTTVQQDLTLLGQRRINLIWEYTQAAVAVMVVLANMVVGVYCGLNKSDVPTPPILSNSLFLVIGFYFARTNHQNIGGTGEKALQQQDYVGR